MLQRRYKHLFWVALSLFSSKLIKKKNAAGPVTEMLNNILGSPPEQTENSAAQKYNHMITERDSPIHKIHHSIYAAF